LLQALAAGADMVAPFYEGKRGNPVGFSAACLPELLALQGDQGARALLAQSGLQKLPVSDSGILRDIDTPADLSGA
jgi:molybdenum cofactor cytidylyltransferase